MITFWTAEWKQGDLLTVALCVLLSLDLNMELPQGQTGSVGTSVASAEQVLLLLMSSLSLPREPDCLENTWSVSATDFGLFSHLYVSLSFFFFFEGWTVSKARQTQRSDVENDRCGLGQDCKVLQDLYTTWILLPFIYIVFFSSFFTSNVSLLKSDCIDYSSPDR